MFAFLGSEPGRRGQGQRRINSKRTVLLLVTAMLLSCLIFDAEQSFAAAEKVPYTVSKASTGVKFKVASKGLVGTCAQAGTKAKNGTATLTKLSNSSAYAKVAYYYGVKKGWDKESASSTQYKYLMLMMQYISDRSALRGWNSYTQKLAKDYLSTAKSKAKVPDTFEIYKANPGNASQDFVAWKDTKPVKVKLLKKSTDAGISSAGGYSFAGIRYRVYKSDKKTSVGVLTCGPDGTTNTLSELAHGTYYAKEIATNRYYALSQSWLKVTAEEGKTAVFQAKDVPLRGRVSLVKGSTEAASSSAGYTFSGIRYRVYDRKSTAGRVLAELTLDASGKSQISGFLPVGTWYVREYAANRYYAFSGAWYSVTVSAGKLSTLPASVVKDKPNHAKLEIRKTLTDGETTDEVFTFTLTNQKNRAIVYRNIKVRGNGTPVTVDILAGTYIVSENDPGEYIDETGDQVITVKPGETGKIRRINSRPKEGSLQLIKTTDDGGPREGFRFRITGRLTNQKTMTEETLLKTAAPQLTIRESADRYRIGAWSVDQDDLAALDQAAAEGRAGTYSVKLSCTAKAADAPGTTGGGGPSGNVDAGGADGTGSTSDAGIGSLRTASAGKTASIQTVSAVSVVKALKGSTVSADAAARSGENSTSAADTKKAAGSEKTSDAPGSAGSGASSKAGSTDGGTSSKTGSAEGGASSKTGAAGGGASSKTEPEHAENDGSARSDENTSADKTEAKGAAGDTSAGGSASGSEKASGDGKADGSDASEKKASESKVKAAEDGGASDGENTKKDGTDDKDDGDGDPSGEGDGSADLKDLDIVVEVHIVLKPAAVSPEGSADEIRNVRDASAAEAAYDASWHEFDWYGAAAEYTDAETGKPYTDLVTNAQGVGVRSDNGQTGIDPIEPGVYTAEEVMTDDQRSRYHAPEKQTKEWKEGSTGDFRFTFLNRAKVVPVSLKKTSEDGKISGISFRLTGRTFFGEEVSAESVTDREGNLDFGSLYKGEYVIEETGWDSEHYANTAPLEGYSCPAKKLTVTGDETEPIRVSFENAPYASLLLTKIDAKTRQFLPGSVFKLVNKSKNRTEAVFQIVEEDGMPSVRMMEAVSSIGAKEAAETEGGELPDEESGTEAPGTETPGTGGIGSAGEAPDPQSAPVVSSAAASSATVISAAASSGKVPAAAETTEASASAEDEKTPEGDGTQSAEDAPAPEESDSSANVPEGANAAEYMYVMLTGLTSGDTYEVTETNAPTGYGVAPSPVTVEARYDAAPQVVVADERSEIGTKAVDSKTGDHISPASESVTIVDTISYRNLIPGKTYRAEGVLMDKTKYMQTGNTEDVTEAKDASGKSIKAVRTFIPKTADGTVDVRFTFDAGGLAGASLVAFEELYAAEGKVAEHKEAADREQTIVVPKIATTATAGDTGAHLMNAGRNAVIRDVISYENLLPGKTYTVKGTLMDKSTGRPLISGGAPVRAEGTFRAASDTGTTSVTFRFDAGGLAGTDLVAFEEVYLGGKLVAEHKQIGDTAQTVSIPSIGTKADHPKKDRIVDTVAYEGLIPGETYIMSGVLVDKDTGEEIPGTRTEKSFSPKKSAGEIEIPFGVDEAELREKDIDHAVAFEKCRLVLEQKDRGGQQSVEIASHEDLNDEDQTVDLRVPPSKDRPPRTGDSARMMLLLACLGMTASLIAAGAALIRRRLQ